MRGKCSTFEIKLKLVNQNIYIISQYALFLKSHFLYIGCIEILPSDFLLLPIQTQLAAPLCIEWQIKLAAYASTRIYKIQLFIDLTKQTNLNVTVSSLHCRMFF